MTTDARAIFPPRGDLDAIAASVSAGTLVVATDELTWRGDVRDARGDRYLVPAPVVFARAATSDMTGREGTWVTPTGPGGAFAVASGGEGDAYVVVAAYTEPGLGFAARALQANPEEYCTLVAGAAVAPGDPLGIDGTARSVPVGSGDVAVAFAVTGAAAAGDRFVGRTTLVVLP